MKYALLTALIIAALVWVDLHVPLTGLTPTVRATDAAVDRLAADLIRGDRAGAQRHLAAVEEGWQRSHLWLSLLGDKASRNRFEQLVQRIQAGLAAGDTAGLAADAAELREVWYEILSP